jgi:aminopeptidase YwaD
MIQPSLAKKAAAHLRRLCLEIPGRRVGSAGNRAATDFFAETVSALGFETACPAFDCLDWHNDGVRLTAGDQGYEAFASPYSLPCQVNAPLQVLSTLADLEAAPAEQAVFLLRGDLAREPLMPKNFPFYNPAEHQQIIRLLEAKDPPAIVSATARSPELAGALDPFPLIEDGDFDIPSVYLTEEEGGRLAAHAGRHVSIEIRTVRRPATGCNVVARAGKDQDRRVVLFAHIDAKEGTAGALDNAAGITVLLLLAEVLAGYTGDLGFELVAMNGEDHYASPGQLLYLHQNEARFGEILLGVNLDGLGYRSGETAYSLYNCASELAVRVRQVFSVHPGMTEGEPWYQGDHALFLMNDRPAVALTSSRLLEIMTEIVHTPLDTPEVVDEARLATTAMALKDLLLDLNRYSP